MKRKGVVLITRIALVSILAFANSLFASTAVLSHRTGFPQRALVIPDDGSLLAQGGMLRERLHERERAKTREVEEELEKNPKLVDDPNYLAPASETCAISKKTSRVQAENRAGSEGLFCRYGEERGQYAR
jgi:hypothetical protein